MRRHRRGIGPRQLAQTLQDREGDQRQERTDTDHDQRRNDQLRQRLAGQLNTAFESDGEQQEDAQGLVEHRRNFQIGACQAGKYAEQEKQDYGFKRHCGQRKSKRRELFHPTYI